MTAGGADALCVECGYDLGGSVPGGVLLKDITYRGSLRGVDAVVLIRPDVIAEGAVAAQGNALHGAFALAAAQFLGQLGAVILGKRLHQAFQNDALGAVHHRLGGVKDLDAVLAQAAFVDGRVVAVAGQTVRLPADHGIKDTAVAVRDHLLERRAAVRFAGDVPVDVLFADGHAVGAGIGFAVMTLALDALLGLAAAAGIAVVSHQAQGTGRGFFAGHGKNSFHCAR